MKHTTDQDRAEFDAWSQANNKYHVSGYNPHNDLWEAWQGAREAVMLDGWKLAPVEPTPEMVQAGRDEPLAGKSDEDAPEDYKSVYRAMLAAAPQPPEAAHHAEGVPEQAAASTDQSRAQFDAWIRTHEEEHGAVDEASACAAWSACSLMQVTNTTMHGLEQFIEQVGDVHFQRCRVGSKEGDIRWDIEFGHYGAKVRDKTLRDAITKALAAQDKQGGEE